MTSRSLLGPLSLIAVGLITPVWELPAAGLRVDQLRCEYREAPVGIDVAQPRLSWVLASRQRAQRQTAYQILVASSATRLNRGEADLWDSGRVASDQSIQIGYAGKPLGSRQRCF